MQCLLTIKPPVVILNSLLQCNDGNLIELEETDAEMDTENPLHPDVALIVLPL